LQGAFEKIQFHRFVRQYSLESKYLPAQYDFARTPDRGIRRLLQSVTPTVQQMASYPELSAKPRDVVARVHSFNSLPPKLLAVSLASFSLHFAAPFPQSVQYRSALV